MKKATPAARNRSRVRKPAEVKRSPIRKRHDNEGSERRIRKVTIRLTERLSNELASIQGLIYAADGRHLRASAHAGVAPLRQALRDRGEEGARSGTRRPPRVCPPPGD